MEEKIVAPFGSKEVTRVQQKNEIDYVKDGVVYKGSGSASVMVESQSDLAGLEKSAPGTIAFTAGYVNMWQKKADGTWVEM